ncbi:MAG TPA: phosphatidate cytidylyltransferase [Candidatus Eisenbacteria bacterium]|jgi:phosphatidate cytidylyltransferase|nr:phosphatidate cytidylyltransferase [Candidatus Eisenbacteria bacterium]
MTSNTEAGVSGARTEPAPPPISRVSANGVRRTDASLPFRIASAVIFLPLLVLAAKVGGPVWLFFSLLVVGLGLREFYQMMESKGLAPHWKSGTFAVLLLPIGAYLRLRLGRDSEWNLGALLTVLVGAILLAELRRGAGKQAVANIASTLLGVVYIGWFGSHIALLRELPRPFHLPYALGASFALLPFFLAWVCDTAAYAVGLAWGRTKLMPDVSPQKSVEGAIAGLLATVGAAFLARATFAPYLSAIDAAVLGVLVGVLGQLGDLVESLLKRDADAKDTSRIIPGHGGVLDRFDSVLFAAPVVAYYILFRVLSK